MVKYSEKYNYIREEFSKRYLEHALGDEYLESIGETPRLYAPMIMDAEYGILYLRDDAVQDLLRYIRELEERCDIRGTETVSESGC